MEDSLEEKQQFLRSEILEKNYDPNQFLQFLVSKKGEEGGDLAIWSIEELQQVVGEFITSIGSTSVPVPNEVPESNELPEQNQIEEQTEDANVENQPQNEENKEPQNDQQPQTEQQPKKDQQPHKDFTKIKGKVSEKTELGKFDEVTITVSSPEKVEGGLFSKSYVTYLVTTIQLNTAVRKRYSDFEWLSTVLTNNYLGSLIHPIPKKNYGSRFNEAFVSKRMRTLEKFLKSLTQDPLIRNSQILFDFLTIGNDEEFNKKKNEYTKMKPPTGISEMKSLEGLLNVGISQDKEILLTNIKDNATINETLLKKLNTSYKALNTEFAVVSTRLMEISETWNQLFQNCVKYADNTYVTESYKYMSNFSKDLSENLKKQASLINIDIREYFKFLKREFRVMKEFSLRVENDKNTYYKAQEKLDGRKEDLFKKQDITKWEIDPNDTTDKTAILQNKEIAFEKMLPKETLNVKVLKINYGFYLNRIIEEYQRLREQNGKNHSFCISVYCQKHTSLFAELQASLGEVIAFLGDGTYRKLELVTDQKLTVKEKEKKKKEKEKEEEEKKEEKKEETNE